MSNIMNSEPQAFGSITFNTTFGLLDIELFTQQCPKTTRNFVQLCLDGYYEQTIFDRVEKDFIVVGGVPKGGYEQSLETTPDEFHSRLRFKRRGLLATANSRKGDNGPKFFFTLGATPELQNKHTIFGRVKGESIYTLVELNNCQVDKDLRPLSEQLIKEVQVSENPFTDVVRQSKQRPGGLSEDVNSATTSEDEDRNPKSNTNKRKKLSFYYDDESDQQCDEKEEKHVDEVIKLETIRFLSKFTDEESLSDQKVEIVRVDEIDPLSNHHREGTDASVKETEAKFKEKRLREIRTQIQNIKQQIEDEQETKTSSKRRQCSSPGDIEDFNNLSSLQQNFCMSDIKIATEKGKHREHKTIELVRNFKQKLKEASLEKEKSQIEEKKLVEDEFKTDELAELDKVDGDQWLKHRFETEDDITLAKDANIRSSGWYGIDDPGNLRHRPEERHESIRGYSTSRKHRKHHRS